MNQSKSRVPENLQALLDSGEMGYRLTLAYFLKLKHSLMPMFPALYKGTENVVLTTDFDLIKDVWRLLPPRESRVDVVSYYVNERLSIGFPVLGPKHEDNVRSRAQDLLTRERFIKLIAEDPRPFEWAPGLISLQREVSEEEFLYTIATMRKEMTETA